MISDDHLTIGCDSTVILGGDDQGGRATVAETSRLRWENLEDRTCPAIGGLVGDTIFIPSPIRDPNFTPPPIPGSGGSDPGDGVIVDEDGNILPAITATEPSERYVQRLYRDLLGRTPDDAANPFIDFLKQGGDRRQVVDEILHSTEYLGRVVDRTHRQILGRIPDAAAKQSFIRTLQDGGSIDDLRASLAASREFRTQFDSLDDYTKAVFDKLLDRDALRADHTAFHRDAGPDGQDSNNYIAGVVAHSDEAYSLHLEGAFEALLGRDASQEDIQAFVRDRGDDGGIQNVLAEILTSDEYYHR